MLSILTPYKNILKIFPHQKFRVNTKDNIIKVNQIFAHGFGFRGNIDLTQPNRPELLPSEQELHHNRKRRSLTRREVYETLEELINQFGIKFLFSLSRSLISQLDSFLPLHFFLAHQQAWLRWTVLCFKDDLRRVRSWPGRWDAL
jgi:PAS domain-containing protein